MRCLTYLLAATLAALLPTACQRNASLPGGSLPLGTEDDIVYAQRLWQAMVANRLVGDDAEPQEPFFGGAKPHGMILELAYRNLAVGQYIGFVVVKKNYNGPDVSEAKVKVDRSKYLDAITVMYQREAGYDPDNQNWFWVKYRPDGSLFRKPILGQELALAGRIVKGESPDDNSGCLYCHSSAGGGDYIFYPEIQPPSVAR